MTDITAELPELETKRVTTLSRDELRATAASMARMFGSNPFFEFCIPRPKPRQKALEAMFVGVLNDAMRHGRVDIPYADNRVVGCGIWYAPGAYPMSVIRQLKLLPMYLRVAALAPASIPRIVRAQMTLDKLHPKEPHYYFFFGGVDPAYQSRGIARAVFGSLLDEADASGIPCYLETQEKSNADWYARLGFEVLQEGVTIAPGSPPSWTMWRPARPAA